MIDLSRPILVIYDDVRNKVEDIAGEIYDFADFCRSIELGTIKNVRLRCPTCNQAILKDIKRPPS